MYCFNLLTNVVRLTSVILMMQLFPYIVKTEI